MANYENIREYAELVHNASLGGGSAAFCEGLKQAGRIEEHCRMAPKVVTAGLGGGLIGAIIGFCAGATVYVIGCKKEKKRIEKEEAERNVSQVDGQEMGDGR